MRLRVRQLACLLFLLASITAAAGDNSRHTTAEFAPRYVAVLQELHARNLRMLASAGEPDEASHVRPTALDAREHAALDTSWPMMPAAAHTSAIVARIAA
ncbi:hypothetical protein ACFQBQ_15110 [Granulicella cerasi]|uniref:Uncharacterized protein n=1 Tax=Granulicella cerasi TaxID=741063 RepID=A0ABW1ZFC8_9BACT|nr:hypothetical protein [Granulicella cerasi]